MRRSHPCPRTLRTRSATPWSLNRRHKASLARTICTTGLSGRGNRSVRQHHGSKRVSGGECRISRASWEGRGAAGRATLVPARDERGPRIPNRFNRYGSSLRIFDANDGIWRVHWCNPVDGEIQHSDRIAFEEERLSKAALCSRTVRVRWIFSTIAANSFEARAEHGDCGARRSGHARRWRTTVKIQCRRRQDRLRSPLRLEQLQGVALTGPSA